MKKMTIFPADRVAVLCDATTARLCYPLLRDSLPEHALITVSEGDDHKDMDTLAQVWRAMQDNGMTRHSWLVNLGGGMVTDLGGFAAATYKRGIRFTNVPTTLLAMVDAATGGKTGVNFNGLKNEVGAFREADEVVIDTDFLKTLDDRNLRSGFAEMLKHALLKDEKFLAEHLKFNLAEVDYEKLQGLVGESVEVKKDVVAQDPHEKGLRKALNLGHTVGHAIESLYLEREHPLLHGYAVAWGLVAELFLSSAHCQFPTQTLRQVVSFINEYFGRPEISCNDYDKLLQLMRHDKKNCGDAINFTLLANVGEIRLDQNVSLEMIREALDFLREG